LRRSRGRDASHRHSKRSWNQNKNHKWVRRSSGDTSHRHSKRSWNQNEDYGTTIVIEDGGTFDLSTREAAEGIELKKLEIKGGGRMKVRANEYNAKTKTATIPAIKVGNLKISDGAIIEGENKDSTYLFATSGTTKYTLTNGKVSKI